MAGPVALAPGVVLAAAPMMWDPNFRRSVVLLCDHGSEGGFGLIINRPLPFESEELQELLGGQHPELSFGGPVQPTSLHYLHDEPDAIPGADEVIAGVLHGGDFEMVKAIARDRTLADLRIRFFLGYAGWGPGQLDEEVANDDWIVSAGSSDLIFEIPADQVWSVVLERLGGHYALMANFPADPRLN